MGARKGKLITCDRCGATLFLKFLGTEDGSNYGGAYDKYDPLPDDWMYQTCAGYMCPECAKQFKTFVNEFFNGKVAPAWQLKGGDT